MASTFERRLVTAAMKDFLVLETGFPVGISTAPLREDNRTRALLPYYVLNGSRGPQPSGPSFANPQADIGYEYQITSVGEREDQVELIADKARAALIARDSGGNFLRPLTITGMSVMDREMASPPGPITREGTLYNVVDSYIVWVTPSS